MGCNKNELNDHKKKYHEGFQTEKLGNCRYFASGESFEEPAVPQQVESLDEAYKGIVEMENTFEARKPRIVGKGRSDQSHSFFRSAFISPILKLGTMECEKNEPLGQIFKPDDLVVAQSGARTNWDKGHQTERAEVVDIALDVVRREIELCECFQRFQLTYS